MDRQTIRALLLTACIACGFLVTPAVGVVAEEPSTSDAVTTDRVAENASVELVALYETDDGYVRETVLTPADVDTVGEVRTSPQTGKPFVSITLTQAGAENISERMSAAEFDGNACRYEERSDDPGDCLLSVVDGEVVFAGGVQPSLLETFESGAFQDDPTMRITTDNESQARELRSALLEHAEPEAVPTQGTSGTLAPTTNASAADATDTDSDDGSSDATPGLGVTAAVAAVVLGLVAATVRRRRR